MSNELYANTKFVRYSHDGNKKYYLDSARNLWIGVPVNAATQYVCEECKKVIPNNEVHEVCLNIPLFRRIYYPNINRVLNSIIFNKKTITVHSKGNRTHLTYQRSPPGCAATACPICGAATKDAFDGYCSQKCKEEMVNWYNKLAGIQSVSDSKLSPSQEDLLNIIKSEGPICDRELSELTGESRGFIFSNRKRLEVLGLVKVQYGDEINHQNGKKIKKWVASS